jgi:hypothetical protein
MWLSPNGIIRMDATSKNTYRVKKWDDSRNDWFYWFDSAKTQRLINFMRVMKLTEYSDVPDHIPEVK